MKGSDPFSSRPVRELETVAADEARELVHQRARRAHRPLVAERQRAARLAADVVHRDRAAAAASGSQDLLEAGQQAAVAGAGGQTDHQASRLALAQLVDRRELLRVDAPVVDELVVPQLPLYHED